MINYLPKITYVLILVVNLVGSFMSLGWISQVCAFVAGGMLTQGLMVCQGWRKS